MPNPILRAGPFATSSDSFVDEPTPAVSNKVPVNCATNDWASGTVWKAYRDIFGDILGSNTEILAPAYADSLPQTYSFTINSDAADSDDARITFNFAYQAAVDTTINIDASASSSNTSDEVRIQIVRNGTAIENLTATGVSASVSYDDDFPLPASVVPTIVQIEVFADCGSFSSAESGSGSITVSVST